MERGAHAADLKRLGCHKSFDVLGEYLEFGDLFDRHALKGCDWRFSPPISLSGFCRSLKSWRTGQDKPHCSSVAWLGIRSAGNNSLNTFAAQVHKARHVIDRTG